MKFAGAVRLWLRHTPYDSRYGAAIRAHIFNGIYGLVII